MLAERGLIDVQALSKTMDRAAAKQAMPFVTALKKQLDAGLSRDEVLAAELPFDERAVFGQMVPGLRQVLPRCRAVKIVRVEGNERRTGTVVDSGAVVPELPPAAAAAAPGNPRFSFENLVG